MADSGSTWLRVPPPEELAAPGPLLRTLGPLLRSRESRATHPTADDPGYFEWEQATAQGAFEYYARHLPEAPQRILDVGAGPGGRTMAHAKGSAHRFLTLDRNLSFQATVAARACGSGGAWVKPVVGDATSLPFPDQSLDACLCENALEHFSDPGLVIREMRRVVRPRGLLLILLPPWRSATAGHLSHLTWLPWIHLLPGPFLLRLLAALDRGGESSTWRERTHALAQGLTAQLNGWSLDRILEAFDYEGLELLDAYVLGYGRPGRFLRFLPGVGEFFASAVYLVYRRVPRCRPPARCYRDLARLTFRRAGKTPSP